MKEISQIQENQVEQVQPEEQLPAAPVKSKRGRKKSTQSKTTKKERRLLQNRESAFRFRIKRKSEFETLHQIVKDLEDENSALKQQVQELRDQLNSHDQETATHQIQPKTDQTSESRCEQISKSQEVASVPSLLTGQEVNTQQESMLNQLARIQSEISKLQQLSVTLRAQQEITPNSQSPNQNLVYGQVIQNVKSNRSLEISTVASSSLSSSPVLKNIQNAGLAGNLGLGGHGGGGAHPHEMQLYHPHHMMNGGNSLNQQAAGQAAAGFSAGASGGNNFATANSGAFSALNNSFAAASSLNNTAALQSSYQRLINKKSQINQALSPTQFQAPTTAGGSFMGGSMNQTTGGGYHAGNTNLPSSNLRGGPGIMLPPFGLGGGPQQIAGVMLPNFGNNTSTNQTNSSIQQPQFANQLAHLQYLQQQLHQQQLMNAALQMQKTMLNPSSYDQSGQMNNQIQVKQRAVSIVSTHSATHQSE